VGLTHPPGRARACGPDLRAGMRFPFYGYLYGEVHVGSNGYITLTRPDSEAGATLTQHYKYPRISGLFTDLDPSGAAGARVTASQLSDRLVVSFDNVPHFYSQQAKYTFQVLGSPHMVLAYSVPGHESESLPVEQRGGSPEDAFAHLPRWKKRMLVVYSPMELGGLGCAKENPPAGGCSR